jgi:hypothetical protein
MRRKFQVLYIDNILEAGNFKQSNMPDVLLVSIGGSVKKTLFEADIRN